MRTAAKVDANQATIIARLRTAGVSVQSLAAIGKGVPDLLCGYGGRLTLLEVKDGAKVPSARKLTADQIDWHATWRDVPLFIVTDAGQALAAVGVA